MGVNFFWLILHGMTLWPNDENSSVAQQLARGGSREGALGAQAPSLQWHNRYLLVDSVVR